MKTVILEVLFNLVGTLEETPVDFVNYHNEAIGKIAMHLNMDILSINHVYVEMEGYPDDPSCICTAICLLNGQTADSIIEAIHKKAISLSGGRKLDAYKHPHKVAILISK